MRCYRCGADEKHEAALQSLRDENAALARGLQQSVERERAVSEALTQQRVDLLRSRAEVQHLTRQLENAGRAFAATLEAHPAVRLLRRMAHLQGELAMLSNEIPAVAGLLGDVEPRGGRS